MNTTENTTENQFSNETGIIMVDFINDRVGEFRAIIKVQAGFMTTIGDLGIENNWETGARWKSALDVFRGFRKGALQTIEFKARDSRCWITVFARKGNKIVVMDRDLFSTLTVGDINQNWTNTTLYSQKNYNNSNAKTWADLAFKLNK
jgi:hypothetical protein